MRKQKPAMQSARQFFHEGQTSKRMARREFLKKAVVLIGGSAVGAFGVAKAIKREIGKRTIFLENNGVARARQWAECSFNYNPLSFKKFPLTLAEMKSLNKIVEKAGIKGEMGGKNEVERVLSTLMRERDKKTIEQYKTRGDERKKRIVIVWKEFEKLPVEQQYRINEFLNSLAKTER